MIHGHHTSRPILKKRNISARTEADSSFEQCPPVTEQGSSLLHKQSKIEEENSTSPEITPELSPDLSGRPKAESTETESDAVVSTNCYFVVLLLLLLLLLSLSSSLLSCYWMNE